MIWYPFQLGGQLADRWMWCAESDRAVINYDSKSQLLAEALADGKKAVVFTLHKNGTITAREYQP